MDAFPDDPNAEQSATPKPRLKRKADGPVEQPKPEKIRVELNIEKWPAIWRPSKSKKAQKVRILEREFFCEGGRNLARLEIGFTDVGTTTTEDQRMFYALIKLWEEKGKPNRPVYFSDRLLARILKKNGWGTNVIEAMGASLQRLRTTPLRWTRSYHRNGTGRVYEEQTFFTFLENLKIATNREHGHITDQRGYFQFDPNIFSNLVNNFTKPLMLDEFFTLKTEIGQLLYTHADMVMADKTQYERCTKDLFLELGLLLDNPSYRYASNRKQILQKPIAELQGKRLSTGLLRSLTLVRTKDGTDYKLVFVKTQEMFAAPLELPTAAAAAESVAVDPQQQEIRNRLQGEAEELVQFFHKTVHGMEHGGEPLGKELDQAAALIGRHGLEQSRYVVQFAFAKARETKFDIQHFGGILNYSTRAVADFERHNRQQQRSAQVREKQAEAEAREQNLLAEAEARLAALTPAQHQALYERAKADLFNNPIMARQKDKPSAGHEGAIRKRMLDALSQPTD